MKQLTLIERQLARYADDEDLDLGDTIHRHFESRSRQFADWMDVSREGLRLHDLMLGEVIDEDSPQDYILQGVAAAAHAHALQEVAWQLGVSLDAIQTALETDRTGRPEAFLADCKRLNEELP